MINNSMEFTKMKENTQQSTPAPKKPNELGTVQLSSHIKIYDPNSKEVLVNKRGDE